MWVCVHVRAPNVEYLVIGFSSVYAAFFVAIRFLLSIHVIISMFAEELYYFHV